jgi:hypothetical protein
MTSKFLFTWEETTLLNQELNKRKKSFLSKYWESGLFEWKWEEQMLWDLQNAMLWWWFLATKKLIIIHGIPKDSISSYTLPASIINKFSPWLQKHRDQIPDDHVLVLVTRKPDKRTSDRKHFSKICTLKEFKPLSTNQRLAYAKQHLWTLLNNEQYDTFVHSAWSSLGVLSHEVQKIQLYTERNKITSLSDEQLTLLVANNSEDNAFLLLDRIVQDTNQAIRYLDILHDQWNDPFQTMWMLYRWLKIIIGMIDSWEQWISSSKEIASRIKAPPFTISKFGKYRKEITSKKEYRKQLFSDLVTLDHALKTWKLPLESFRVSIKHMVLK